MINKLKLKIEIDKKHLVDINWDCSMIDAEDNSNYWYRYNDSVVAPKTIIIKGGFSSGKTIIFNCLREIKNRIVKQQKYLYDTFEIELEFFSKGSLYAYNANLKNNIYEIESLYEGANKIFHTNNKRKSNLTKAISPDAYLWFDSLQLIPSIYDCNTPINNTQKNKSHLTKYAKWFCHNSYGKTVRYINNQLHVIGEESLVIKNHLLSKSTSDLIYYISEYEQFMESECGVMIIDDFDLVAKSRFMHLVAQCFSQLQIQKPLQIIGFINDFINVAQHKYVYQQESHDEKSIDDRLKTPVFNEAKQFRISTLF